MKLVAITGAIGCGKTTLANLVRELGYVVFDVDKWSRALYLQPKYIQSIAKAFPTTYENGNINKKKLREIVFNHPDELKKLENISHPLLKAKFKEVIFKNRFSDDIFFVDAALLFETDWDIYCDMIIVVDVDYDTQKQRVMCRDNVSEAEFEAINNSQLSNEEKIVLADVVVETDKPLNVLKVEMMSIIDELSED